MTLKNRSEKYCLDEAAGEREAGWVGGKRMSNFPENFANLLPE